MGVQDISKESNKAALIACMVVAIVLVSTRGIARWYKYNKVPVQSEDLLILFALASFVGMCGVYLGTLTTLYNVQAISAGQMAFYDSLPGDLVVMLKLFFAVQILFWMTLWSVKLSLLFLIRRLTVGLQYYKRVWWAVLIFTLLTFVGCFVSQFTSCSSMTAWFTAGLCSTDRDTEAKAASLWYSLAVDLLTDLLIMAIPVRLLWTLRISTIEKFSIGIVFVVGMLTMVFAIVRVVSLDSSTTNGQVSTSWLILWGAIEGVVAILVGCLPAFAVIIRARVVTNRSAYLNYASSGNQPPNPTSRQKNRVRAESVLLDEVEPISKAKHANHSKPSITSLTEEGGSREGNRTSWHDPR